MKRIFTAIAVCCLIISASWNAKAETRWGVVAVGNYSTLKFNQDLLKVDGGLGGGFGLTGEIIIPGIGFAVDGSIIYSLFTSSVDFGEFKVWNSDGYGNEKYKNHTIDIPLNLKFKYSNLNGIENYIAPLAYVGPSFTINIKDGSRCAEIVDYQKVSVGIHVGIGCELFRKVQVSASYTWGINNTFSTIKLDDFSAKNKFWRFQVAYMF